MLPLAHPSSQANQSPLVGWRPSRSAYGDPPHRTLQALLRAASPRGKDPSVELPLVAAWIAAAPSSSKKVGGQGEK